ncbi:Nphp3 [Symbiodinium sp. CCMP2592]|nr:Nphp3 [Symbiodinium sp. CCMP2592]
MPEMDVEEVDGFDDVSDDEGLAWAAGTQETTSWIRAEVTIPEGCEEGDVFEVLLDDIPFEVTVPKGKKPNDLLQLEVPADELKKSPDPPEPSEPPELSDPQESEEGGQGGLQDEKEHRHVSFTDEEPAVVLFRPEVGGLQGPEQTSREEQGQQGDCDRVELTVPSQCRPGDVLTVRTGHSQMELTVPEGCRPGDVLEVNLPEGTGGSLAEGSLAEESPEQSVEEDEEEPPPTEAPIVLALLDGKAEEEPIVLQPENAEAKQAEQAEAEEAENVAGEGLGTSEEPEAELSHAPTELQSEPELEGRPEPLQPEPELMEATPESCQEGPDPETETLSAKVTELEARNAELQETIFKLEREKKFLSSSLTASLTTSYAKSQVYLGKHAKEEANRRRQPASEQKQAHVQTEPAGQAWGGMQAMGDLGLAPSAPALPELPQTLPNARAPHLEDWEKDDASIATLKMAVLTLKQQKEDLRQKLAATQREKIRLELQERNSVQLEAYAHALLSLKTENAELREIALQVLRGKDASPNEQKVQVPRVAVKARNKISQSRPKSAEAASKWLNAPSPSTKPRRHKVLPVAMDVEDLENEDFDGARKVAPVALPVGHAGGLQGAPRRLRSQSDGCVRLSKPASARPACNLRLPGARPAALRGEAGLEVLASPGGASKVPEALPEPDFAAASPVLGDSASTTSVLAWSSWRQRDKSWAPNGQSKNSPDTSTATTEGRLATAAIYAGAAMNANTLGWGATARAAEAAARQKYTSESKKFSGDPDLSSLDVALIAPLADDITPAQVNERSASGALVLEPGQAPQLQCVDPSICASPTNATYLAADDGQLRSFFIGGSYLDGKDLAACCPQFSLVDDGTGYRGDGLPIFRHSFTGALLLGHAVFLCPSTGSEDLQLLFRRGPLSTVRRFGQGLLGCAELLYEFISGSDDGMSPRDAGFHGGFLAMRHGPRSTASIGETGGSESDSKCYVPIVVDVRSCSACTRESLAGRDFDGDVLDADFVSLTDVEEAAGFVFQAIECRLERELHNSDGEGRAVRSLAHFLSSIGRTEEAAKLWQQAIHSDEEGKDSKDTLQIAHAASALASCLDDLGRAEEAEPLHSRALASFERALGRSCPDAASARLALMTSRYVQGLAKKHGILPSAGDALLRMEGASAHALATIFSKAVSAEKEEDSHGSELFHRQALGVLRRALGRHHPDTLHCLNNLALCLGDQGKLKEAEQLLRRTLAGMEVALPPSHPRPIQALSNLAGCLAEQGNLAEAEQHHRKAFQACKRKLGWKHPETAAAAQSLVQFLMLHGHATEAALLELQAQQFGTRLMAATR